MGTWMHLTSSEFSFDPCKFTAIVPGAYPGLMANFWTYGLNYRYWETVEDRWVHAVMRLTSIESSFFFSSMWHLPRLSQVRTQGRPKCALGWLQKLTHVPLAIAILLVIFFLAWEKSFHFLSSLVYIKSCTQLACHMSRSASKISLTLAQIIAC